MSTQVTAAGRGGPAAHRTLTPSLNPLNPLRLGACEGEWCPAHVDRKRHHGMRRVVPAHAPRWWGLPTGWDGLFGGGGIGWGSGRWRWGSPRRRGR